jgi:hypothetical protein
MPFVSKAQQGFMHANPDVLGKKGLAEWDAASKGSHNLPEHVHEHKKVSYKMAREARKKD